MISTAAQIGITYLAVLCVWLSYSLVNGRGAWRNAKWVGKGTLLLLGWMALPDYQEPPAEPRLSEQKRMIMERVASYHASRIIERENDGHK